MDAINNTHLNIEYFSRGRLSSADKINISRQSGKDPFVRFAGKEYDAEDRSKKGKGFKGIINWLKEFF